VLLSGPFDLLAALVDESLSLIGCAETKAGLSCREQAWPRVCRVRYVQPLGGVAGVGQGNCPRIAAHAGYSSGGGRYSSTNTRSLSDRGAGRGRARRRVAGLRPRLRPLGHDEPTAQRLVALTGTSEVRSRSREPHPSRVVHAVHAPGGSGRPRPRGDAHITKGRRSRPPHHLPGGESRRFPVVARVVFARA
jgi:hypothetical protein